MLDLSGKNVVYVGAFGGVGYQVCRILMKKNIKHLVICSRMRNVEMMKKLQDENSNVEVLFVGMDITERSSIEQALKQIVGLLKSIDVLINGVGVLADKDVATTVGVNLTGLINTTLACLPYMDKSRMGRGGVVVNISSVYGVQAGSPGIAVYAAAKHGVVGFTRSMANEHYLNKTGVSFVCVCPGLTATELMMNLRAKVNADQHDDKFVDAIAKARQQSPEECAVNVVNAMELAKNGAVYICNLGTMQEVTPGAYWQM